MLNSDEIAHGKLVLDAGCGNGRYTNQAAKYGVEVIGVDLGYGIKSAYKHLKDNERVHIVQGDLFNLPFKKEIFDTVFSNGVLMHTGNAKKAFYSICKHVKRDGIFVSHLYHKRNIIFEIVDHSIRFFTTRMSIEKNMKFAKRMARWGKRLKKKRNLNYWFHFIEVLPTTIHMFDWYSAQIATHHTFPEVEDWYKEQGFEVIQTDKRKKNWHSFITKPEALTVKGRKK